jgi:hypothetical protein
VTALLALLALEARRSDPIVLSALAACLIYLSNL